MGKRKRGLNNLAVKPVEAPKTASAFQESDRVIFHYRDVTRHDFADEGLDVIGLDGKTREADSDYYDMLHELEEMQGTILKLDESLSVIKDPPCKDAEVYTVEFDNCLVVHGVSGYHLSKVPAPVVKRVKKHVSLIDSLDNDPYIKKYSKYWNP